MHTTTVSEGNGTVLKPTVFHSRALLLALIKLFLTCSQGEALPHNHNFIKLHESSPLNSPANANRQAGQIGVQLVGRNAGEIWLGKLPLLSVGANKDLEASVALLVDRRLRFPCQSTERHREAPNVSMQHVPAK